MGDGKGKGIPVKLGDKKNKPRGIPRWMIHKKVEKQQGQSATHL
jgi:hypothetical protein